MQNATQLLWGIEVFNPIKIGIKKFLSFGTVLAY